MTQIYFVRHAQPDHGWKEDATRPLSESGKKDSQYVTEFFRGKKIDYFYSSPYKRSFDTIEKSALELGLDIQTDWRFREREKGNEGNQKNLFQRRWADFDFHEEGGESLAKVQARNIEALMELLVAHPNKSIVIGTHGTALSTIIQYFEPAYGCADFIRMVDFMPFIVRLDFEGISYQGKEELLIIEKVYLGNNSLKSISTSDSL